MHAVQEPVEPHTATVHPLTPLTADEIRVAVDTLRTTGHVGPATRFISVALHEPAKDTVIGWTPCLDVSREAHCVVLDRETNTVTEAVIRLGESPEILSWTPRPGAQPAITLDEFFECEEMLKADPAFQTAVRARGISDFDLLMIDPWSAGSYADDRPEHAGLRLVRALTWVRSEPGDNGYSRPLQGLLALVDLNAMTLLELTDEGGIPIPPDASNYIPRFHQRMRPTPHPLEIHQPEGPGFDVDDHEVCWEGWSFRVGFTPREGLVLHQVAWEEDGGDRRPILYRASMVDMVVPYGDPHPHHARKNAFDCGEYGIGMLANSLTLGCDCLGVIRYFDAHLVSGNGTPITIKNAVCLHEEDYGILWKHMDWRTNHTEVRRSRRLVISFISTVGNYEYGFFWYFYLDGTIQYEIKLTGIMNTGALPPGEKRKFGTLLAPGLYAPIHQHVFSIRLDMMVDGSGNRVDEVNSYPLPSGPDNPYANGFYAEATPLSTSTARDMNLASARYWKVVNPNVHNAMGEPVAYKVFMGENTFPMVSPESSVRRRAGYMDHHFWVTAFDPAERYATGDYPNQRHPDLADGLPAYAARNRPTDNSDLVVWLTLNSHHVPRLEDWPVMPCGYIGFHLKPVGFFDRNPAINLPATPSRHSVEVGACCCSESPAEA